ncbi:DNA cytosine methyltransferase [Bradyrhizobium sp. USDA 3364]
MGRPKALRAIDLYSGVGGWSLGLKMSGIKVVASYERSALANLTNRKNNRHRTHTVNLREFDFASLPKDVDVVVGSPPCIEFSFANRGGNGDISDGLRDITLFFEVVSHLKPRFWAMENVPRVSQIIEQELRPRGKLRRFSKLPMSIETFNMEEFGLPQRRKRCIVGNFDFELLRSYSTALASPTLGDVVAALGKQRVRDPLSGLAMPKNELTEHYTEEPLDEEEVRINRSSKLLHPVYNAMPFPDRLDRSARTITATCTRVGRESIVIRNEAGEHRRLTLRERASLQGFPITFEFFGQRYSEKLRMIGNAMPPSFSFYIGAAIRGEENPPSIRKAFETHKPPQEKPPITLPDRPARRYRWNRTFRFSIPELRLKSGVRFELVNSVEEDAVVWAVSFYFGTSKSIHEVHLDDRLLKKLLRRLPRKYSDAINSELSEVRSYLKQADPIQLQRVWTHTGPSSVRPFELLDRLNATAATVKALLLPKAALAEEILSETIETAGTKVKGKDKLLKNAITILAGLIVGSSANVCLSRATPTTFGRASGGRKRATG